MEQRVEHRGRRAWDGTSCLSRTGLLVGCVFQQAASDFRGESVGKGWTAPRVIVSPWIVS